jgi:hypothetical protein
LVLLINAYTLSSTKVEIRAKQFLPGRWRGEGAGRGRVRGQGEAERNDPNIVCTYE